MAQLIVRNLEEEVKTQLQERAMRHGRSMEEEVREILRTAAAEETTEASGGGLGSRIVSMFSGRGLGFELPERPAFQLRVPDFVNENEADRDDPA